MRRRNVGEEREGGTIVGVDVALLAAEDFQDASRQNNEDCEDSSAGYVSWGPTELIRESVLSAHLQHIFSAFVIWEEIWRDIITLWLWILKVAGVGELR